MKNENLDFFTPALAGQPTWLVKQGTTSKAYRWILCMAGIGMGVYAAPVPGLVSAGAGSPRHHITSWSAGCVQVAAVERVGGGGKEGYGEKVWGRCGYGCRKLTRGVLGKIQCKKGACLASNSRGGRGDRSCERNWQLRTLRSHPDSS